MPKLKPTERQRRETELRRALEVAKVDMGLRHDQDLAALLGVAANTFSAQMRDPLRASGADKFARWCRTYHIKPEVALRVLGYTEGEDNGN